jgi:hypothetical protein
MNKKRSYEDRLEEFQISLLNMPVDLSSQSEVAALTALDRAGEIWGDAAVIEGEKGRCRTI